MKKNTFLSFLHIFTSYLVEKYFINAGLQ